MDRCTGHCCKTFPLPVGPAELRQRARWARRLRLAGKLPGRASQHAESPTLTQDGEAIAAMARPIAFTDRNLITGGDRLPQTMHWYTCRNLQANGDCGIYSTRPQMCRGYPYGARCDHPNCTWAAARSETGPWPQGERAR